MQAQAQHGRAITAAAWRSSPDAESLLETF
jgi:hypothetical protein